ncbi:MAG: T9SS type A sorting domain-containing protein, partial [Bacteroidetes bacterium]|nr:T9SS type A sorting domain-containing protein [Bacteroidota bacterium]
AWSCNNITIQFCESYNNSSGSGGGCDGLGFDFDGGITNSLMQYNYSHDNDGAGYLLGQYDYARPWSNNTVRYNISENDGRTNAGGITLFKGPGTTMEGVKIYHNTVYLSPSSANAGLAALTFTNWNTGINGVEVYNNIFQTTGSVPFMNVPTGYSAYFAGNLYWPGSGSFKIQYQGTTYTNLNSWRTATGNEKVGTTSTGIVTDPLLTNAGSGIVVYPKAPDQLNAYKLAGNSPAINTGLNLMTLFSINTGSHDFFNNTAPNGIAPDIGAYESNVVTSLTNYNEHKSTLYPNPVEMGNDLQITGNDLYSIELFTITGTSVWKKENINSSSFSISTRNFAIGIYFLRLTDNSGYQFVDKLLIE